MNGTSFIASAVLPNPGKQWSAIGTGDFNGDGNADILFQKDNGTPMIWEMNGTSITTTATFPNPGAPYTAIGTSDFNGDGMADILFQRSNGPPLIWEMNGTSVVTSFTLPSPGPQWKLQDDGPISPANAQPTAKLSAPDVGGFLHLSAPDMSPTPFVGMASDATGPSPDPTLSRALGGAVIR
jgi:hypothetical protein